MCPSHQWVASMLSSALETVLPTCQTAEVRGCGLGRRPCFEPYPFQTQGEGERWEGDWCPGPEQTQPLYPSWSSGDQSEHRLALKNITSMVRSGGLLVIDHRNYDHILSTGCAPPGKNIYYKVGPLREGGPRVGGGLSGPHQSCRS